jgi:hypothetical protein
VEINVVVDTHGHQREQLYSTSTRTCARRHKGRCISTQAFRDPFVNGARPGPQSRTRTSLLPTTTVAKADTLLRNDRDDDGEKLSTTQLKNVLAME